MSEVSFEKLVEFARSNVSCCHNNCGITERQFCFATPVTLCPEVAKHYRWIQSHSQKEILEEKKT